MTRILSPLRVDYINNTTIVMLHEPFGFVSDVLASYGMMGSWRPEGLRPQVLGEVWGPDGFVFDFESIPNFIRGPIGENKRGGAAHDILSRKNVCTGITQAIAADVYLEIMDYCDSIDHAVLDNAFLKPIIIFKDWSTRGVKSEIVRYWPKSTFWQKYELTSSCEEITGYNGDPYVTIDKLEALIEKTEQVSSDLKDVDINTDSLVKQTDKATEGLKDAKDKIS